MYSISMTNGRSGDFLRGGGVLEISLVFCLTYRLSLVVGGFTGLLLRTDGRAFEFCIVGILGRSVPYCATFY